MTETTYRCDRCDSLIDRDRVRLLATVGRVAGWPLDQRSGRSALDLCPECRDALGQWLTSRAEPQPQRARVV